jgi:signal transduction histidine kinase
VGGVNVLAHLRSSRRRLSGAARVWGFAGALAGISMVALLTAARSMTHPLGGVHVPWWALAAGFAVAEVFVLRVRIARDTRSLSLSEVPLVIGLAFSPAATVVAQAVGLGAALALRQEKPLRSAFQIAQRAVTTLVAVFVFVPIVRAAGSSWPSVWFAAFAATLIADIVGGVLANAAIAVSGGERMRFEHVVGVGTALTFAKTALALGAAMMLMQYPAGLILLTIPAAGIYLAGQAYVDVQRKHDDVVLLQRATRVAQRSLHPEDMLPLVLEHLREMFHADISELVMPDEVPNQYQVSRVGPGEAVEILAAKTLDPTRGVWARVAAEGEGVLLARPIGNPQLAEHFSSLGIADAIVAPVTSEDGPVGVLMVANRVGGFSTFNAEDLELLEALANEIGVTVGNGRVMQRLEGALAREMETNKLKDDFLATISHELRSPLTSIQGYVKTMLGAGAGMPEREREEFLAGADRAGERLRSLIEDLLFTSRVETSSSAASNRMGPVGLAGLVERVVAERVDQVAPDRIVLRFPSSVPPVWTSEDDVRRVVSHLLDNALKYSPDDGSVTVWAEPDGAGVRISFQDRGPGIPESERERIFDRFYQVERGLTRSNGGAGLGLHICQRTAESLGGRVWLDRSDESGSVFCLWLPTGEVVTIDDFERRRPGRVGAFVGTPTA